MHAGKIARGLSVFAGMALAAAAAQGSPISAAAGTYTQSFDSLPVVAASPNSAPWTNDSTISGWSLYAVTSGSTGGGTASAITAIYTTAGGNANGQVDNFGASSTDTDRSLGSVATDGMLPGANSGTNARASFYYVAEFVNDTGSDLSGINVGYTGEEWRAENTTAQALTFQDYVGSSPDFSAAPGYGGWSSETINTGLTFTSPVTTTAGALDGHLAANSQVIAPVAVSLSVPAGSDFFIRWRDINDSGTDDGLAINNVSVSFVAAPEPALFAAPLLLLAAGRRRRA